MNKKQLRNGMWKLTSKNGIRDTRNGQEYSEVICKEEHIDFFEEA